MNEQLAAPIEESRGEAGQALAEYGLILAFILAAAVIAVTALGLAIAGAFGGILPAF